MIGRNFFIAGCILVGVFSWANVAHAADNNGLEYRYIKWEITQKKAVEGCAGRACIQVSEFNLTRFGQLVAWPEATSVTNPDGESPEDEGPSNLIDGDTATKWLDHNFNADESQTTGSSTIVIDAGESVAFDGYEWATANDSPERDPISWNIYGSNDGENWTLIDEVADENITDTRLANTSFSIYGTFFTGAFSDVTKTSVTLSGDLFPGKVPLREIGFLYDTDPLFSSSSQAVVETETYENMAYSAAIAGLSCGTRYFYKAYAVAEDDMSIDSEITPSFFTAECTVLADEPLDGRSYEALGRADFNESWTAVAASSDGQIMAAAWAGLVDDAPAGSVYVSADGGSTWEPRISVPGILFISVAISADGQKMVAVGADGYGFADELGVDSVYVSEDGGITWGERSEIDGTESLEDLEIPDPSFLAFVLLMGRVSVSDDFSVMYLSLFDEVYRSMDAGHTWERIFAFDYPGFLVSSLDVSADGQKAAFAVVSLFGPSDEFPSVILTTTVEQWTPIYSIEEAGFFSIEMSSNGRRIFAIDSLGRMHVSLDEGLHWQISDNPDGYGWVSVVPSETGNGVFAAALNELTDDEEVETTLLALYYSADGGSAWEKISEIDVSDRSYALAFGAAISGRISAAYDLSRIGLTNLFDLYVVTRGEVVAPPPPDISSHRNRSSRNAKKRAIAETTPTLEGVVDQYRDLFLQAHTMGAVLPQNILDLLGLLTPAPPPIRDLQYGVGGEDVRALQNLLISQGYSIPAGATGFFAMQTRSALVSYQAKNGIIPAVGYFGPITQAHMKAVGLTGVWW